jgi:hypothetical protein
MRAAILAQGPENVGSTYWRALQHVPRLERRGVEVDVLIPREVEPHAGGRVNQAVYFARHALAYLALGATLRRDLGGYDAVLVQRGAYPMGPSWNVRALDRFHGRVVLDLDDNVFATSPRLATKRRAARWLYGPQQTRYLLERADSIIVSTEELARVLPGRTPDFVLPTVPDIDGYPTVTHTADLPIQVGWTGNAGNLMYLDALRDVFERLFREGLVTLEVMCSEPWDGPATFRRWSRSGEVDALSRYDVGIMPLPDTAYTRAKAGFKMLMYMGVGSAVLTSPVGINSDLINSSGAGVLCRSPAEWEAALRRLASDRETRERMGTRGQWFVRSYSDLETQADRLLAALGGGAHRATDRPGRTPRVTTAASA